MNPSAIEREDLRTMFAGDPSKAEALLANGGFGKRRAAYVAKIAEGKASSSSLELVSLSARGCLTPAMMRLKW